MVISLDLAAYQRLYLKGGLIERPVAYISIQMQISRPQLRELTEAIEDTIEYICDQEQISGELAWTVVECLATAKLAELKGELAPA